MDKAKILRNALEEGTRAESTAEEWLRQTGFHVLFSHEGKPSNKPYDIIAVRGKEKWAIEVKTGKNPSVNLRNFKRLLDTKGIEVAELKEPVTPNKVGYIFVVDDESFLLEYDKRKHYARKAVKTMRERKVRGQSSTPKK